MLYNNDVYNCVGIADILQVMWHGLPHDLSLSGYLTIIPGLMLIARQWTDRKWLDIVRIVYFDIISIILSLIFIVDTALYEFWGTKLDTTPIFYFLSSPTAAAASVSTGFVLIAIFAVFAIAGIYCALFHVVNIKIPDKITSQWKTSGMLLLLCALLFIPIRGGFTVATMNISAVYFSNDNRLNHAAINPAFSLMYAATHESDFGDQFNYFDNSVTKEHFSKLMDVNRNDTTEIFIKNRRPDIYLIILESFSSHLMPSLGGEPIANELDSIARNGLLFTNFYASSFRTDRALPAILSGYPAQPSTSIMKYVKKAESLPSIVGSLKDVGYSSAYYYGGDANFTNMKAYLMSSGFDKIISDRDFDLNERASKWGAPDHKVFGRCIDDNVSHHYDSNHPIFTVIQTSSSHEPFEVPYNNPKMTNPAANAFAYTDSCTAAFVKHLKESPNWNNSLVILVSDHYGAYPPSLEYQPRHQIPLILTGGALTKQGRIDIPASQNDIAATLLAQLDIPHDNFKFSKNIFTQSTNQFAAFSMPSYLGWVTPKDTLIYDIANDKIISSSDQSVNVNDVKSFYQMLYDDLDQR